ncbi:MAG: ATP-dependent RNA helicase RhlB [Gammaproteobacteria bacterium]|nr:ATP-dependent RNA helicase RhlB [Gammaproteobacteria bacterium]MDH5630158.1 ATP-dependent RNA helicase RhlB [Gammaproteobacteria bacterium]
MVDHLSDLPFKNIGLHEKLINSLNELGFEFATPIQAQVLPLLLDGKDVAGQAQTGTGKTNAFLLAVLNEMLLLPEVEDRRKNEPRTIIIAPTRELVLQIYEDAKKLSTHTDFKLCVAYGGADYTKQQTEIANGCDILIGTPGRLIDFLKQNIYNFYALDCVVLDEADRMFDLGFITDIRYLFRKMPPSTERLNMLFSATLSHRVRELAYEHMNAPTHIQVEADQVTADKVTQALYYPANNEKLPLLVGLLKRDNPNKAMIFTNTKRQAEAIYACLLGNELDAGLLTGDVQQNKRIRLLNDFKSASLNILIATDVAARGLHIDGVTHVYNYDLPDDAEDYVHRIGRTARAGQSGDAISFACEDNAFNLPAIEKYIGFAIPVADISPDYLVELLPSAKIEKARPVRKKRSSSHHKRK